MAVAMRYGSGNYGKVGDSNELFKGTIDDASTVVLTLPAGGLFELFTAEYTDSSGAYRGHRSRLIKTPEDSLYGTTASQTINESASTNSGVTITMNTDSTVSIARSSATYAVKYVVRSVGTNIGNPSSNVSTTESARDQAQIYANNAAASATEAAGYAAGASAAIEHYPKIEDGNWYVWDVSTSTWLDTGIQAEGEAGATPNLTIGAVTTGAAGSSAAASITGTPENPVLNLTIPRGQLGNLIVAADVTVAVSDWTLSSVPISADFPYEASISIPGVTASMIPEAVFNVDDAMSGNYAPVVQSAANAVIIYAATVPESSITIPTIMVHVGS